MPWEEKKTMSLREELILRVINGNDSITEICKQFSISRKTAYKWINRYQENGVFGLQDLSKRPLVSPTRISDDILELIASTRNAFPAWGGKKLRQYLINTGKTELPCEKTFNRALKKLNLIDPKESEKRTRFIRFEREFPNELWQMDFKGHFKIANGRCHPLTILDDHSRFSICLKACLAEDEISVKNALIEAFRMYGLPNAMTMDNGPPWKGSYPFRLSRLTIWLMRLEIKIGHSTPYHPQTQGKDERFHRSFKDEVLKYYQFQDLADSQKRFDEWRELYNNLRPHEGIGMKCPIDRYRPSLRVYPETLRPIEYSEGDEIRRVGPCGTIGFRGKNYFIGEYLSKEYVALREIEDSVFDVYFSSTKVQRISLKK